MIFPATKDFCFRANSDSPLEVAAKALADKNGHRQLWQKYEFSMIRKMLREGEEDGGRIID